MGQPEITVDAIQLSALLEVTKSLQWLSEIIEDSDNATAKRVTESARLVLQHVVLSEQQKNLTDHGRQLSLVL